MAAAPRAEGERAVTVVAGNAPPRPGSAGPRGREAATLEPGWAGIRSVHSVALRDSGAGCVPGRRAPPPCPARPIRLGLKLGPRGPHLSQATAARVRGSVASAARPEPGRGLGGKRRG